MKKIVLIVIVIATVLLTQQLHEFYTEAQELKDDIEVATMNIETHEEPVLETMDDFAEAYKYMTSAERVGDIFDELDGDSSEYRAVLKAYQEKTFPLMRKNLAVFMEGGMVVYGEGYSTADMVSPGFSSASVASDFYEDTSETYDRFRFKRVNFKATDDGPVVIYFDLDTPEDGEKFEKE